MPCNLSGVKFLGLLFLETLALLLFYPPLCMMNAMEKDRCKKHSRMRTRKKGRKLRRSTGAPTTTTLAITTITAVNHLPLVLSPKGQMAISKRGLAKKSKRPHPSPSVDLLSRMVWTCSCKSPSPVWWKTVSRVVVASHSSGGGRLVAYGCRDKVVVVHKVLKRHDMGRHVDWVVVVHEVLKRHDMGRHVDWVVVVH
eukprot:1159440-Pelagomonas_calceolata.AAC.6